MNTIVKNLLPKIDGHSVLSLFKTSRFLQAGTAILVLQLVLAGVLGLSQKTATFAGTEQLFTVAKDAITTIDIESDEDTVQLKKQDTDWIIDGDIPLPVDAARLNTLLSSLSELNAGLPVANTTNAREQLEVADDNYQRKLIVNGEDENTFLIGTSPGLRKAHLRRKGGDEIYSATLAVSDIPASIDQWLDRSLLALEDVTQISSDAITFTRAGTSDEPFWEAPDHTAENKTLDTDKLTAAVDELKTLRVTGISTEIDSDDSAEAEKVELIVTNAGTELTLNLEKTGETATIKRSDINKTFVILGSLYDQLAALGSQSDWLVDITEAEETNTTE